MFVLHSCVYSQTTYNPTVQSSNTDAVITQITLTTTETVVKIRVPKSNKLGSSIRFDSSIVLVPCDVWDIQNARESRLSYKGLRPVSGYEQLYVDAIQRIKAGRKIMSDAGWLIRGLGSGRLDVQYKTTKGDLYFELHFDRVPIGVEYLYIRELDRNGLEWYGIRINNPYPTVENLGFTETTIKSTIDQQNDGIVGIYQGLTQKDVQYKLACIKHDGIYKFIFLTSKESLPHWKMGEVKALLHPTANPATFQMEWHMADKTTNSDCYAIFEGTSMKVYIENEESVYIKMYPAAYSSSDMVGNKMENVEWSGTGFALNDNYIATNYHVVENANSILIHGVNGDTQKEYQAQIVAIDKINDLAILLVEDAVITGIPYSIKTTLAEVGEDIFVLGYPLTSTMGNEIKLVNGIISSKSGYQGDLSLYQISAPLQPGNSGGPLFDQKGNVIGIISSKHAGTENVGYAIKSSYLRNLMESVFTKNILPQTNTIANKNLSEKKKIIEKYVFYITCSK